MLCDICDGLSVSLLVDLADIEYSYLKFPQKAFYQHHASLEDLLKSADAGCKLCATIVECTKLEPHYKHGDYFTMVEASYKAGKSTDVKICLNSSHNEGDQISRKGLDLLYVQFGPQKPLDYDHDEVCDSPSGFLFDPVPLAITIPLEHENVICIGKSRLKIGRWELDYDLASEYNFDIARLWIADCVENHDCCPGERVYELPTRLVCIGREEDWSGLRLVQPPPGTRGQYGALSHCWGGDVDSRLTRDTLARFRGHIPFSDLPRNFQDALVIAREVGCYYLWIDSLCIIQDSPEDWAVESAKMTDVYSHATLTICASTSVGSKAGIFNQWSTFAGMPGNGRNPSAVHQEIFARLRVFPKSSPDDTMVKIGPHVDPNKWLKRYSYMPTEVYEVLRENLQEVESHGALNLRAWALQEKVLSPRRLIYGKKQLYWQCASAWCSADGLPEGLENTSTNHLNLLNVLHNPNFDWDLMMTADLRQGLKQDYYGLVWDFQSRALTVGTDKFPSFAGVVRVFHSFFEGVYLAGLWSTDFHTGLMWSSEDDAGRWSDPYRAPTWSWASRVGAINFRTAGEACKIYRKRCACPGSPDLELLSHKVILQDTRNPYGQVTSGSIVVRGHTKRLIRSRSHLWTRTEEKTKVGSEFDISWDEWGLIDEEIYRTSLDGEDVLLILGDEDGSAEPPPNPEAEFLLIFVATTTNHICDTKSSADDAPVQDEGSAENSDGEETESLWEKLGVCWPTASDEGGLESPEKDAGADLTDKPEKAASDTSWELAEGTEEHAEMQKSVEVCETPEEDTGETSMMSDLSWMWGKGTETGYGGISEAADETEASDEDWKNDDWDDEIGDWKHFDLQCLVLSPEKNGPPGAYRRDGIIELKMTWEYVQSWKMEEIQIV